MSNILGSLQPESLFKNFENLSTIPRESGNEKAVSDYLVEFAKENGLEVVQEECLNIIIKKPGTKGYEDAPTVILQGHMDMVCVKKEGYEFDFAKDSIPLVVDGDMIRTEGTTLGADNGIAVAMAMAVLESKDMPHPPIVALITVEEETGMGGVLNLQSENVSGDILINIDSEEEGTFLSSCAGGVRNKVSLPIEWKDADSGKIAFNLSIKGLLGGHSGIEINKNRASAIKLLGRLLHEIRHNMEFDIVSVSGGEKMNAIPKMADAQIMINEIDKDTLENIVKKNQDIFTNEFKTADGNIKLTVEKVDNSNKVFSPATKLKIISMLKLMPFGVNTMSEDIKGLVESSNNIGVLTTEGDIIKLESAVRSSVRTLKADINNTIEVICDLTDASMELEANYPEWEYKVDSPIRDLMLKTYKEVTGNEAKIDAIHAGLECGFLKEKVGDIDMISIGPNIYDVHTPEEHLSISSSKRVFDFLCEVLKNIK